MSFNLYRRRKDFGLRRRKKEKRGKILRKSKTSSPARMEKDNLEENGGNPLKTFGLKSNKSWVSLGPLSVKYQQFPVPFISDTLGSEFGTAKITRGWNIFCQNGGWGWSSAVQPKNKSRWEKAQDGQRIISFHFLLFAFLSSLSFRRWQRFRKSEHSWKIKFQSRITLPLSCRNWNGWAHSVNWREDSAAKSHHFTNKKYYCRTLLSKYLGKPLFEICCFHGHCRIT